MTANDTTTDDARSQTPITIITNSARFALGQIVATPGALDLLEQRGFSAVALISRHVHGDWGDCCEEDTATNEIALAENMRVMSVYRLVDAERLVATSFDKRAALPTIWIITEWDRSVTTLLLPKDY